MEPNLRTAKLALARQKLKNHQEKKLEAKQNEMISFHDDGNMHECRNLESNESEHNATTPETLECLNETIKPSLHLIDLSPEDNCQVTELQSKLLQLENSYTAVMENLNFYKQGNLKLNNDLEDLVNKCAIVSAESSSKDISINDLSKSLSKLVDENNDLKEQLEFTKSLLASKEMENSTLSSQVFNMQNQLELTELHLQQLSNGRSIEVSNDNNENNQHCETLTLTISSLEQQLENSKKEREQARAHYEQYVKDLNEQLQSVTTNNEQLRNEMQQISERENNLVEHISEMEIIIQNLRTNISAQATQTEQKETVVEYKEMYESVKLELEDLKVKYDNLRQKYLENEAELQECKERLESNNFNRISIDKLNADIASDKIAAQKATEQNKKLKSDLHKLEDDFVKMSKDKLELTEKLTAEKYLNRELTIKLSEIDQEAKNAHSKLKAKDEEMIRLQVNLREAEKRLKEIDHNLPENTPSQNGSMHNEVSIVNKSTDIATDFNSNDDTDNCNIPMGNAMIKLQNRFLKIMNEVANLSDEKQRLEHIILQLQNETDTICEYVALYQQQRSMLKRRDEERNVQIKLFQQECELLTTQLKELSNILIKLANDDELSVYFKTEPRCHDLNKIMNLLSNLQTNAIVDTSKQFTEFKNFYPCSCCSGQLIVV